MRRNFAQILKDAKIDIKVEYQKLYGMLYDRSIQVSNTNRISVYDELSTYFIAFHFRGTCLSLDEFRLMMCGRGIIICQSMCAGMYWAYIMKSTIGRRKSISSTIAVEN